MIPTVSTFIGSQTSKCCLNNVYKYHNVQAGRAVSSPHTSKTNLKLNITYANNVRYAFVSHPWSIKVTTCIRYEKKSFRGLAWQYALVLDIPSMYPDSQQKNNTMYQPRQESNHLNSAVRNGVSLLENFRSLFLHVPPLVFAGLSWSLPLCHSYSSHCFLTLNDL